MPEEDAGIEHIEFEVSPALSSEARSDAEEMNLTTLSSSEVAGRQTRMPAINGEFIRTQRRSSYHGQLTWSVLVVFKFLRRPAVVNFMGVLTMFDGYLTCADIDRRAAGRDQILWMAIMRDFCLIMYTIEYVLWCWVKRCGVLADKFLLIDLFILITGFVDLFLERSQEAFMRETGGLRFLSILRIIRILRVLKLLRRITYLKELRKLLTMATTCMKTLLWSFLFCFLIMTVWAMLLVDLVHPLVKAETALMDCDQCQRAAGSVMDANLLLFKTVVAGDSWGEIAVPIIQAHPATAVIFVGSLLTLEFGVLNLIVAVVVDTFAELRERDVMNRAEELEAEIEQDRRFLQRIFDRADEDGSGELTFEELLEGARNDPEFQSRLRVMDIDEADLQQLFKMIDVDGSGAVERDEFVQPLSRWVHESKTATRFIKYNVARALHENEELREHTNSKFEQLNTNINRIAVCLGVPLADSRSMTMKRSSTKTLQTLSAGGTNKPDKDPSPSLRRSPTSEAVGSQPLSAPTITKQKSIVNRLKAMEEQQKTFFKSLLGTGSGEDLALPQAQGASQSQSQSVTMSTPTSSLSIPGFAASQDARGKPGRPEGPPPSSDGDEVPAAQDQANKKEKAEGIASLQLEDADEVDAVESRLDFSGFKDFYNKRRHSLQDSAHMSPDSRSEDSDDGVDTEFLHSRSSVREMDSVLRGTMEVVEDLLQSAASAAVTRAEYTLRLRLGTLMSEMGAGAGRDRAYSHQSTFAARGTPKGEEAMSPALLLGSLGPEERHRWPAMRHLEAVVEADECPAPPPNQRARSLGEPPPKREQSRKRSSTVHVDVVESYPVQI